MTDGRSTRRWIEAVVLLALSALVAGLALASLHRKSMTFDEPVNVSCGHHWWVERGDTSPGDIHHPPLADLFYGLPLLSMDLKPMSDIVREQAALFGLPQDHRIGSVTEGFLFGTQFVFENRVAGPAIVNRARLAAVALTVLLVLATWWTARGVFGPGAAMLAAGLIALSPNVLAHGRLALGDIPQALFVTLFVGGLVRLTFRCTVGVSVVTGLALGAAVATKVSSLLFVPVAVAMMVLALIVRRPFAPAGLCSKLPRRWAAVVSAVLVTACALAVPWALYARNDAGGTRAELAREAALRMMPMEHQPSESETPVLTGRQRAAAAAFRWMPLPIEYARLIAWVGADAGTGRPTLVFGRRVTGGRWYYFPGTLLLKTPLPVLILLMWTVGLIGIRLFGALGRREETPSSSGAETADGEEPPGATQSESHLSTWPVIFFGAFIAVYLAAAMTSKLNIGHRHLLPIFGPVAAVVAGVVVDWFGRRRRLVGVMLAVLGFWQLVIVLSVWPNYLSYFNPIAGGPENGHRYYVGSNLDWGQDLPALAEYQREENLGPVRLHYFGTADPAAYGVQVQPRERGERYEAKPGVYAISATVWMGVWNVSTDDPLPFPFLRNRLPRAVIDNTIFVFDSPAAED